MNSDTYPKQREPNTLYGVEAWNRMIDALRDCSEMDTRMLRIFMEHHILMQKRLTYLGKLQLLEKDLAEKCTNGRKCKSRVYAFLKI